MAIEKVNLAQAFSRFSDHWSPKIVGDLNDSQIKVVKVQGEFVWHQHDHEDELFLVVKGRLTIQLRDGEVVLEPGEFVIIPKGVAHRPIAPEEVEMILIEPKGTFSAGNTDDPRGTVGERL
jgi:mannose-6-phosphate isomerase-like protein (cupin superfamily)